MFWTGAIFTTNNSRDHLSRIIMADCSSQHVRVQTVGAEEAPAEVVQRDRTKTDSPERGLTPVRWSWTVSLSPKYHLKLSYVFFFFAIVYLYTFSHRFGTGLHRPSECRAGETKRFRGNLTRLKYTPLAGRTPFIRFDLTIIVVNVIVLLPAAGSATAS